MYGVENRFKISFSLGLKGVPLYREIPATKNHLSFVGDGLRREVWVDESGVFLLGTFARYPGR